jgi:hypothetical protein
MIPTGLDRERSPARSAPPDTKGPYQIPVALAKNGRTPTGTSLDNVQVLGAQMGMTLLRVTWAVLLWAAVLITGCSRRGATKLPPGAVVFDASGVALVPGDQWNAMRTGRLAQAESGDLCLPVLEGEGSFKGGVIMVYASHSERVEPKRKAELLRKSAESRTDILKTTIREENFKTDSGLHGVHLAYNQMSEQAGKVLIRTHFYLVKNKSGHCVAVSYLTLASRDSVAVHEMIRKTLTLE